MTLRSSIRDHRAVSLLVLFEVAVLTTACSGRIESPAAPAATGISISGTDSTSTTYGPYLSQLGRVQSFIDSANQKLNSAMKSSEPTSTSSWQSAQDFYDKAVRELATVTVPPQPYTPASWFTAVNGIISSANITLAILTGPGAPVGPAVELLMGDANTVILQANALLTAAQ
jgi:hypothetical protein